MNAGLKTTIELLTKVNNEAAVDVLLPALDSQHQAIQEEALRALLLRRSSVGHREIVRRWPDLDERARAIVAERPARLASVLRAAVLGSDRPMCKRACTVIVDLREYDHVAELITAAEAEQNPQAGLTAGTILKLAERLHDELSHSSRRRKALIVRSQVVAHLEKSVRRYPTHKRKEILEAFLLLATRENVLLSGLLRDPHAHTYLPLLELFTNSPRRGVYQLLLSFLDDYDAPQAALNVIARREDERFLRQLLKKIGHEPTTAMQVSLRRIERIAWLREGEPPLAPLSDAEQHALVQLMTHSGMKRLEVYAALEYIVRHGAPGGRRAAVAALAEFRGADANELCVAALEDPDPLVQAAAVAQLRDRGIHGAMQRLLSCIKSPYEVVRSAARAALEELNAERFLASFELLDEAARGSIARLVRQIDPQAPEVVAAELQSQSRGRRLRAIAAAVEMGLAPRVQTTLIELLEDEDHILRTQAVRALAECHSPQAQAALRRALGDRSAAVQQEAESSLLALHRQRVARHEEFPTAAALDDAEPHLEQLRQVALPKAKEADV